MQDSSLPEAMTKTVLRFLTCGSVDDGKSTLIGRLLYDAGLVPGDQWAMVERLSAQRGQTGDFPEFSLLLDGLLDERAQGITIDVAWRYFQTRRRKFILGDAPGHEQYTRNMATAASQCDLALILMDARKGVLPQTRRHTAIAASLGVNKIVVVVNKMDLIDWDEKIFVDLQRSYLHAVAPLGVGEAVFFPVSALRGDNVVRRSTQMPWYAGPSMLEYLEGVEAEVALDERPMRFPVQWVTRAGDFRGYCGTVTAGRVRVGDAVAVLPGGAASRVSSIVTFDGVFEEARAGEAITFTLRDDIDVTRGDTIVIAGDATAVATDRLEAVIVWMEDQPLLAGRRYELRIGTASVPATVKRIVHRLNLESMQHEPATGLEKNEIGQCELMTERLVPADIYARARATGGFTLIDRVSNATVAAGMVTSNTARQVFWEQAAVDKASRAMAKGQRPRVIWFTGLSGAGKSTIADAVEQALHRKGLHTYLIDGDNVRHGLCKDLGFGIEDRIENTRRVGELAKLMADAGLIVLVSLISPFRVERKMVRDLLDSGEFLEVYVSTPLGVCEDRDRKGLYKMAREGKIRNFTGISSPYEVPESPELVLDTSRNPLDACVKSVIDLIERG